MGAQSEGGGQQKQGDEQGDARQPDQSGREQRQSQEKQKQQMAGQIPWDRLEKQIKLIHQQWNSFEPEAVKAGARQEIISGFENWLNILPARIRAADRYGAQLAANNASLYIPDLLQLYETKFPPDLPRLRYMTRDVVLKVDAGDWAGAKAVLAAMPAIWSRARGTAEGEKKSEASLVSFAMTDLTQAVEAGDRDLAHVKAGILEKNLEKMEKSLEKVIK